MTTVVRFTCAEAVIDSPCRHCAGAGSHIVGGLTTRPVTTACTYCAGTGKAVVGIEAILGEAVTDALAMIRNDEPGRAEYAMVRAQLKAARLLRNHDEADSLADLRFVKLGAA